MPPPPLSQYMQIEGQASIADVARRTPPWPGRDLAILEIQSPQQPQN